MTGADEKAGKFILKVNLTTFSAAKLEKYVTDFPQKKIMKLAKS